MADAPPPTTTTSTTTMEPSPTRSPYATHLPLHSTATNPTFLSIPPNFPPFKFPHDSLSAIPLPPMPLPMPLPIPLPLPLPLPLPPFHPPTPTATLSPTPPFQCPLPLPISNKNSLCAMFDEAFPPPLQRPRKRHSTPNPLQLSPTTPTTPLHHQPRAFIASAAFKARSNPDFHAPTTASAAVDTRPRDHVCLLCGNKFLRRQDLSRHEVTHTRTKQYVCPNGCGSGFGRSDALSRHLKGRRCSGHS